jgi:hypothetical protein
MNKKHVRQIYTYVGFVFEYISKAYHGYLKLN